MEIKEQPCKGAQGWLLSETFPRHLPHCLSCAPCRTIHHSVSHYPSLRPLPMSHHPGRICFFCASQSHVCSSWNPALAWCLQPLSLLLFLHVHVCMHVHTHVHTVESEDNLLELVSFYYVGLGAALRSSGLVTRALAC